MRIAFVQTSPQLGMTGRNLEEAYALIERVRDADLVVLPELFHSGYAVRDRDEACSLAVSADKSSEPLEMCLDACRNFRMHIAAGFLERDERLSVWGEGFRELSGSPILYNSAWLIGPDSILDKYRKIHLFNDEKEIFKPGDAPGRIRSVAGARVAMQICFDWVFPENWGRLAWNEGDDTGAQIIAHPANLVLPEACPLAIRTRAMENRIFIVTAGRVGTDPGPHGELIFQGGSRIIAPDGSVLAAGHERNTGCDMVAINPELADNKYITPKNHVLRERFEKSGGADEHKKVEHQ